ncbi:MAG: transposase [Candidatus Aminicenantes bacterium]|nr:transposase [Candidatus Aminicenantes bacterium]
MARFSRIITAGIPHHIVQRGNRNQVVFFSEDDKALFLKILAFNCRKENIAIWCYCLMNNHFHLIAVPEKPGGLARAIGETQRKYTWFVNARNNWKGHLWQSRFQSFAMDEVYLYNCVRYVERNPVRAGLVERAEEYQWSSARAHVFGLNDPVLSPMPRLAYITDWSAYLCGQENEEELELLRKNSRTGRPLGSDEFVMHLENILGRPIRPKKPGRRRKDVLYEFLPPIANKT